MKTLETIDLASLETVIGGRKLPPPSTLRKIGRGVSKAVEWGSKVMDYAAMADLAYEGGKMAINGGKAAYRWATGQKQPVAQPIEE